MSIILTAYVREGIVMAADSRLSLDITKNNGQQIVQHLSLTHSDSVYKLFLAPNGVGISTCGAADIKGVPISGYVETFISEKINKQTKVDQTGIELLKYFKNFSPVPKTIFHVAGYQDKEQHIYNVDVEQDKCDRINPPYDQGMSWSGDTEVIFRVIKEAKVFNNGVLISSFPETAIPYQFFTLQDAIDMCVSLIRITIDMIKFQTRPKTVGGPIDVLVIKPSESIWVQRKQLHA